MPVKPHFLFFAALLLMAGVYGALQVMKAPTVKTLPAVYFYDKNDKKVTLADFRGKVVLLNLWATWCTPCLAELPALERLQKKRGGKTFSVVTLSLDTSSMADIRKFLKSKGITQLAPYWDKDRQAPLLLAYPALPTSFLLDADGAVIKRYDGVYEWDKGTTLKEIEDAIAAAGAP